MIIIIDINLFFQPNKLYMVFTALTLPVVIVLSYYNVYTIYIKKAIPYLIGLLIILGIVLINEKIKKILDNIILSSSIIVNDETKEILY